MNVYPGDQLFIENRASLITTLRLYYRIILPNGNHDDGTLDHITIADRVSYIAKKDIKKAGDLIALGVDALTPTMRGQCHVQAGVLNAQGLSGWGLLKGYVQSYGSICWSSQGGGAFESSLDGQGYVYSVTLGAIAGNAVTNLAPVNARWRLKRLNLTLTNEASAGNRQIALQITDGTNVIESLFNTTIATISQITTINLGEAKLIQGGLLGEGGGTINAYMGIGEGIIIPNGSQFRITIINGVAGDSYTGDYEVEEWLEI